MLYLKRKEGYTAPSTLGCRRPLLRAPPAPFPSEPPIPLAFPRGPSRPRDAAPMARCASSASATQSCTDSRCTLRLHVYSHKNTTTDPRRTSSDSRERDRPQRQSEVSAGSIHSQLHHKLLRKKYGVPHFCLELLSANTFCKKMATHLTCRNLGEEQARQLITLYIISNNAVLGGYPRMCLGILITLRRLYFAGCFSRYRLIYSL